MGDPKRYDSVTDMLDGMNEPHLAETVHELTRLRAENEELVAELKKTKVDAKRRRTEVCRLRKALKQFAKSDNWVRNVMAMGDDWYWDGDVEPPHKLAADALRGDNE